MEKYTDMTDEEYALPSSYLKIKNSRVLYDIYLKILDKMVVGEKYLQPDYSARMLADELGTNSRYISAAIRLYGHQNFPQMINEYRIRAATKFILDGQSVRCSMADIAMRVGFANRQSFYNAFQRIHKMSPRAFQQTDTNKK